MIKSPTTNTGRSKYPLTNIIGIFGPGQSGTAKAPACYEWISVLGGTSLYTDGVPNACTYAQFATAAASQLFVGPKEIRCYSVVQSAANIVRINRGIGN
jgi:hypothetical protein